MITQMNTDTRKILQIDLHKIMEIVDINNTFFFKIGSRMYKLESGEIVRV